MSYSFRHVSWMMIAALATRGIAPNAPALPHGFYAAPAPNGSSAGDGSVTDPWDLTTALSGGHSRVQPGDTIWLRGGTYRGSFRSTVAGRPGALVVVRQYPGERAVIDGASSQRDTWTVAGEYSAFWGFELTNSDPARALTSMTAPIRPDVIANYAAHTKFINLVVHDGGVALYTDARYPDVEIAGCIFYDNGWQQPDRGHGHALYLKNYTGPVVARDNVIFNQFGYGIHAFTNANSGKLINITLEGNVAFNNGALADRASVAANILLGGDGYAAGDLVRDNITYYSPALQRTQPNVVIGWKTLRNGDVIVERNYVAGGAPVLEFGFWGAARVSGNTLIGSGSRLTERRDPAAAASQIWRDNIEREQPPATTRVFVRPNPYEPGRAHVVVFNWGRQARVEVDVKGVLAAGDRYEVHNVQDLFGAAVSTGTLPAGSTTITIPLGGVRPPTPVGLSTSPAPRTGPEFDAFVVTRVTR
ncbi:MAG TPA: hypothetical protein VKQ05_08790 [Gemmatimonadales bacterium]|nr:hypothetical protein [Gemmatimonadales bacterium]